MKKKDGILIGIILTFAILIWAAMAIWHAGNGDVLQVTVNGELYGTYVLSEDKIIKIGTTNVFQIEDRMVTMIEGDCPDHLCMKQKAIKKNGGGTIVCLPNRVVLEIVDGKSVGGNDDFVY